MNPSNRAEIQSLESRALLSAAVLSDNTLHVTGDNGVTNQISVSLSADGLSVNVSMATNGGAATTQTFAAADVHRVQITGGDGDDTLGADECATPFTIPMQVFGLGGNDVINGGSANDILFGGDGNDTMNGGAGDDKLFGRKGDDSMNGGDGNDRLWGNQGDENLDGGAGNDRLFGNNGANTVLGGDGDDWLNGNGDDSLDGGAGNNHVKQRGKGHNQGHGHKPAKGDHPKGNHGGGHDDTNNDSSGDDSVAGG